MSKHILLKSARWSLGLAALVMFVPVLATADGTVQLDTYLDQGGKLTAVHTPGGAAADTAPDQYYFTMELTVGADKAVAGPRDIVVMFDTSASQSKGYRTTAMAALKRFLGGLDAQDRVKLMAIDVNAVPLTEAFVAPAGPQMAGALEKLNMRVPLGSTDMQKALQSAAGSFDQSGTNPRAAIYIGDGMSRAKLLSPQQFGELADLLADAKVPVSSFRIGPGTDSRLLGALAYQTGGIVIDDQSVVMDSGGADEVVAGRVGQRLVDAAHGTVLWPVQDQVFVPFPTLPARTPPLRTDRPTVILGRASDAQPEEITIPVETAGGSDQLKWTTKPAPSSDANRFLVPLFTTAEQTNGVGLPLSDPSALDAMREEVGIGARNLVEMAKQAAQTGDSEGARRLLNRAKFLDPDNAEIDALDRVIARGGQVPLDLDAGAVPGALGAAGADPMAGVFADAVRRDQQVLQQVIQSGVQTTINEARSQMGQAPDLAIQSLKDMVQQVKMAPDLDPDVRDQLIDQLQATLQAARHRQEELEQRRHERQEQMAIDEERRLLTENLMRKEEKLTQLMARFNSLVKEGNYRVAEEQIGPVAVSLAPNNTAVVAGIRLARTRRYYDDHMALRVARQKAVVDTLFEVEKAHMPFPGEPPIVYPDAEIWRELSRTRIERYSAMDLAQSGAVEREIVKALDRELEIDFPADTPLDEVISTLNEQLSKDGVRIEFDLNEIEQVLGIVPSETPVAERDFAGMSLKSNLKRMLSELELTYVIEDEYLLITTQEKADQMLSTKVYPVADLVLPIQVPSMQGGFGGLNGMSGGGNSGGGGGGMNGGGFGGGGGGNQGGGGGGWSVPPEILPKVPVTGFRAFAVEDDLNLIGDQPASPAGPVTPVATVTRSAVAQPEAVDRVTTIRMPTSKDIDPDAYWADYFGKNKPTEIAVYRAARRMMSMQKFDHAIGLIQGALLNGQTQPWMYEALALAMQADERDPSEVERVLMSAVDFADNPVGLMHIGTYMARIPGLEKRALEIFRQVAAIQPAMPDPHMHGLKLARRIDDLEAKKWASVGILRQAWPKNQRQVWTDGLHTARAVLDGLKKTGRTAEAAEFESKLDDAVARDCLVVVRWDGEADVDMMVEEPAGTVCSFRHPRSTSGGVMLGDSFSSSENSGEGYSEAYVCPQGFDGTYRVLLRRVWGKVTAGKVSVDVYTHYRTDKQVHVHKTISLENDKELIAFDLDGGRRVDSLEDQQIANVVANHLVVRNQILAQQLNAQVDPDTLQDFAQARQAFAGAGGFPFGNNAVGYQPVIIVLPEGTNLSATAVISADRRYVRVTCVPLFSGVAEVNVFNTSSGDSEAGRGGTGGQGFSGVIGNQGGGNDNNQQQF
ncbi:MAG: hypothetical protein HQ581_10800 [Planctomycetes bacterium]|nr:hypothetical protein [Planctomycetota bacterium]